MMTYSLEYNSSTLTMKPPSCSETLVPIYQSIAYHDTSCSVLIFSPSSVLHSFTIQDVHKIYAYLNI
jgi:hypothetical protein